MEVSKITSTSVEHRSHSIHLKLITKSGQSSLNTIVKTSNSLGHGISLQYAYTTLSTTGSQAEWTSNCNL